MSPPSSGSKNKPRKKPVLLLVSCCYSLTLKKEAICYSELSVDFQWTTRRYIPEDDTLQHVTNFLMTRCNIKKCPE
jgi:hypothetical protein